MKVTKSGLLKKPQYISGFETIDNLFEEFEASGLKRYYYGERNQKEIDKTLKALNKRYTILYADYTYIDYGGDAYVLGYDKEEKSFFEVHGGHCSCNGLEGQWEPELCTLADLKEMFKRREEQFIKDKESYYYRSADNRTEFFNWLEGETNEN